MATQLTLWGHACMRLERAGKRLVVDPGAFSDRSQLDTVDAILVTHEHRDHVVPEELGALLEKRSQLEVWAPEAVVDQIVADGGTPDRLHRVSSGEAFVAAGFVVQALGESHALVHRDLPQVPNLAYLIDGMVLHPGDSFTVPGAGQPVEVLLAPIGGPWLKLGDVVDYVRAVRPRVVVPIHDAFLTEAGSEMADRIVDALNPSVGYMRLALGGSLRIG